MSSSRKTAQYFYDIWNTPGPGVSYTGGKIEAIKELRAHTKCGLKEAKDALEQNTVQKLLDDYYDSVGVPPSEDIVQKRKNAEILLDELRCFYKWYKMGGMNNPSDYIIRVQLLAKVLEVTGAVEKDDKYDIRK